MADRPSTLPTIDAEDAPTPAHEVMPPLPWKGRQPTGAEIHRFVALHPRNTAVTRWLSRQCGVRWK